MDLEEHTPELQPVGDRCEECGAKLTPQELKLAMETGGPALCTIHATEHDLGPLADDEPATGE
jgi:methionyl-tRNA synthetase